MTASTPTHLRAPMSFLTANASAGGRLRLVTNNSWRSSGQIRRRSRMRASKRGMITPTERATQGEEGQRPRGGAAGNLPRNFKRRRTYAGLSECRERAGGLGLGLVVLSFLCAGFRRRLLRRVTVRSSSVPVHWNSYRMKGKKRAGDSSTQPGEGAHGGGTNQAFPPAGRQKTFGLAVSVSFGGRGHVH